MDVYEVLTGEAVQDETSKHQIFKDIALALDMLCVALLCLILYWLFSS